MIAWRVNPTRVCPCGQALAPGLGRVAVCACGSRVLRGQWLACGGCGAPIAPGESYVALVLDCATLRRCAECGARLEAARAAAAVAP